MITIKNKAIKIVFSILLILNVIMIYFIDNKTDFLDIIDFEDFLAIVNSFIGIILIILTWKLKSPAKNFTKFMLFFIVMCVFSSLQSNFLYRQSFTGGLLAQKQLISFIILYFPISKIVYNQVINKKSLYKFIKAFAIIQLVLFISQYVLSNTISFMTVHTATRYGEIRYYYNPLLLDLFLIINLNEYVNNSGNKYKNLFFIAIVLFETMVVQKYRLTSLALVIIVAIGLIIGKTSLLKKLFHTILAVIFSILMVNTRIVQDLFIELTISKITYSYSIREVARELITNTVYKHPILGGGYPKSELALLKSGYYNDIYLFDNGIFAFAYIYGCIGIAWVILLWYKMLKYGCKIFKENKNITFILFPLFLVITCINEVHWYETNGLFVFVLFLILLEREIADLKK